MHHNNTGDVDGLQDQNAKLLRLVLSNERLDAYRVAVQEDDAVLFARYAWNIALSEALYPTLQCLEVALRNSIHSAAAAHYGTARWLDMAPPVLARMEREAVIIAKNRLHQVRKPIEPGRLVAELSFGFWTNLLDVRYEKVLWPALLQATFPHVPRRHRTRKHLSNRFNSIRRLRNRVFHHEPIWLWTDLEQRHAEVIEAIGWISPTLRGVVESLDRFPSVHHLGAAPYRTHFE